MALKNFPAPVMENAGCGFPAAAVSKHRAQHPHWVLVYFFARLGPFCLAKWRKRPASQVYAAAGSRFARDLGFLEFDDFLIWASLSPDWGRERQDALRGFAPLRDFVRACREVANVLAIQPINARPARWFRVAKYNAERAIWEPLTFRRWRNPANAAKYIAAEHARRPRALSRGDLAHATQVSIADIVAVDDSFHPRPLTREERKQIP